MASSSRARSLQPGSPYATPASKRQIDLTNGPSSAPPASQTAPLDAPGPSNAVSPSRPPAQIARADPKGKRKADDDEPGESLLKRLAGPSTGKAGLLRDPAEVRQLIYEHSKGSKFFLNEQKRDAELTIQVDKMLASLRGKLEQRDGNLGDEEREVDGVAERLEQTRVHGQTVVVVDCDAFYASVEELEDPSLVGVAFGVGSGVLTTASYEARRYGCRSAMAGYIAKVLCPHIKFVKPKFELYSAASRKIMDILRRYDPTMSPASLDEAYMNITPFLASTGRTAADVVSEMRAAVKSETGLTVSAGIGPTKLVAKIAADMNKPNGQCEVPDDRDGVMAFMRPLPIRKIYGVGRVTERWLDALEVRTVGDIWDKRGTLALVYGPSGFQHLLRAYLGIGSSHVEPGRREDRKSVGCEETFSTIFRYADLEAQLQAIANNLAGDLERTQYSGRTITLKLKLDTYQVFTRAHTVGSNVYISSAEDLYRLGKRLLDTAVAERASEYERTKQGSRDLRLRLMGLRMTHLRDESEEAQAKRKGKFSMDTWAKSGGAKASTSTAPPPKKKRKSSAGNLDSYLASTSVKREGTPEVIELLSDDDDDDSPDWDLLADELSGKVAGEDVKPSKRGLSVPPPPLDLLTGDDAVCPICARAWSQGIKPSHLQTHVEACLTNSPPAPPSKKSSGNGKKRAPSPKRARNAFDALKQGSIRASQS